MTKPPLCGHGVRGGCRCFRVVVGVDSLDAVSAVREPFPIIPWRLHSGFRSGYDRPATARGSMMMRVFGLLFLLIWGTSASANSCSNVDIIGSFDESGLQESDYGIYAAGTFRI